jgi:hypothetical protein
LAALLQPQQHVLHGARVNKWLKSPSDGVEEEEEEEEEEGLFKANAVNAPPGDRAGALRLASCKSVSRDDGTCAVRRGAATPKPLCHHPVERVTSAAVLAR